MSSTAELLDFPRSDKDRLRLALRRLEAALAEQKAAVAAFRGNLVEMRQATHGLASQLQDYQSRLSDTAGKVSAARDAAKQLEHQADSMLERS
ncbi:hypothetical protein ACFOD4_21865 [Pseudoroseomonas globiformis]|uniref:Uncharacterized protein n=1 Tax=Teichococcus globiformis TaxID=2307229 RepID=A0ABV7G934_9PROT